MKTHTTNRANQNKLETFDFKKQFGQNFLRDVDAILDVISTVDPKPSDSILEIGPGDAALTEYLIPNAGAVFLLEIDQALYNDLVASFSSYTNTQIINADILQFPIKEFLLKNKINKVVGALPYNISKKIIELICGDVELKHIECVFVLQKEVAFNYAGLPHTTFLHELYKQLHEIELKEVIEKSKFYPVPKVDSAIIKFLPLEVNTTLAKQFIPAYAKFLKFIFLNPRKKLINNLKATYPQYNWPEVFEKLKFSLNARVEELSTKDFISIFNFLKH